MKYALNMCVEEIIRIGSALLTPAIAITTAYIAKQQWQTNRQKLAIDLYDRRLRIYQEVKSFLAKITREGTVPTNSLLEFYSSITEADFLFEPEVMQ